MAVSPPIAIKRCPGRRIYHPVRGAYITLDELAAMFEDDEKFIVSRRARTMMSPVRKHISVERGSHG